MVGVSALELIGLYRRRGLSPVDVVRALHERAGGFRDLNALLATDVEASLTQARESLLRYREGRARPLEGVPVIVKDLIDTAGLVTTYGSAMVAGHVPDRDAVVVERVRAAGGIVIAKSATHEFAWGITGESSVSGPPRNPWDRTRVPGGSSAGSAAALAVGLAPLALGTDTAGSIRIPAAFCGVAGLRPTFGAVPTAGVFSLAPSLDTVGPMARTVEDLDLLLSVIASGTAAGVVAGVANEGDGAALVVGTWDQARQAECSGEITRVLHTALSAFEQAGCRVTTASGAELPPLYPTLSTTVAVEGILGHRRAGLWPDRREEYHPTVRHRLERAAEIPMEQYVQAQADRAQIIAQAGRVFGQMDVLLSPVVGLAPAAVGHDAEPDGASAREFRERVMAFTALQSLTGLPACTVRAGFDEDGLPVGVQLTAAWGRERTLLAAAKLLVEALPDALPKAGHAAPVTR